MEVLGCGSIATVTMKMVIGEMRKEGRNVIIYDQEEVRGKKFFTPIPKSVADKLSVGDTVTIICVPVKDLSFATDTLALTKQIREHHSEQILCRNSNYGF